MAQVDLLTDKRVRALQPRQKPYRVADGRAMYLLVSPTGGKLWRVKFRHDGKERVLALGQYPDVGIAEARDKRDDARKLIAKGVDPVAHKRGQRNAKHEQDSYTFSAAAAATLPTTRKAWERIAPARRAPHHRRTELYARRTPMAAIGGRRGGYRQSRGPRCVDLRPRRAPLLPVRHQALQRQASEAPHRRPGAPTSSSKKHPRCAITRHSIHQKSARSCANSKTRPRCPWCASALAC